MKGVLSQRNKLLLIALLVIGLIITVIFVQQQQRTRSEAGGQSLDHINLYYPSDILQRTSGPMNMSAQGVDSSNQMLSGVSYTWGISSSGSVGTLTSNNNLATFIPQNDGYGDIWVTATKDGKTISKSFAITVGSNIKTPVTWQTDHVSLQADDFYIIANGKKFFPRNTSLTYDSFDPYAPEFTNTNLMVTWEQNGAEMQMVLNFSLNKTNNTWAVTEIRTNDGDPGTFPRWIYYAGFTAGAHGQPYTKDLLTINSYRPQYYDSPYTGSIHFENLRLQAFLKPNPIPASGYFLYLQDNVIEAPVYMENSYDYTMAYLFNNGTFLKDQSEFTYIWSINNAAIADITPESFCGSSGMIQPCPDAFLTIRGKNPGDAQIDLNVVKSTTNEFVTGSTIALTVVPNTSPTPTPVPPAEIKYNLFLHGRGNGGDNANPDSVGNKNPMHTTIPVELSFFDDDGIFVTTVTSTATYAATSGSYTGSIEIPDSIIFDDYSIKIKARGYLRSQIPGFYYLYRSASLTLPTTSLIAGDALEDNKLDILDYNRLLGCYADLLPAINCNEEKKILSDFNDDGAVNQFDFNLFLREISVQSGD